MKNNFVPVNRPDISEADIKLVTQQLRDGWVGSFGPCISEFEKLISTLCSQKYGISVANGTAAIDVAIAALDLKKGDEIIVPAFTIISCITEAVRRQLKIKFVDCESEFDFSMNIDHFESLLSRKTKAVIIPHIFSFPVDMIRIKTLCSQNNVKIIEDCSEMLGVNIGEHPVGSFGDISTFSFYPNKMITTGEGGMVCTSNMDLKDRLIMYKNLCFSNDANRRFIHEEIGWNYRLTNIQCALGISQLSRLDEFLRRRRELGELYTKALSFYEDLFIISPAQKLLPSGITLINSYWVYPVVCRSKRIKKLLVKYLDENNIQTRPFFYALDHQPVLSGIVHSRDRTQNAIKIYDVGLYLPLGNGITIEEAKYVIEKINYFAKHIIG